MVQHTDNVWFNRQNRDGSTDRTDMVQQTEQRKIQRKFSERNSV